MTDDAPGYHSLGGGGVPFGMDADDRLHWLLARRRAITAGNFTPPKMTHRIRLVDAAGITTQCYADELNNQDGPTEGS